MRNPRLAGRYAKAVLDLAIERKQQENVYSDMQMLQDVFRVNKDFVALVNSPVITADKKIRIIEAVLSGTLKLSELTVSLIKLLISKTRELNLPEIATAYIEQYKRHKDIHTVKLTTAVELSESTKKAIVARIRETSDMQNIELEAKVEEDLIGGFVLQVGDKLVDASVAYDLR